MTDKRVIFQDKMSGLLIDVAGKLAVFLEKVLPPLFDDWWREAVLNSLSHHQQKQVEQRRITTLTGLDLAGLLKVLDQSQNWYKISTRLQLPGEARHFVKEMQTVRNRWAHPNVEGFPVEDIYRDMDTIQRFAGIIGADDAFIEEVRRTKASILAQDSFSPDSETKITSSPGEPENTSKNPDGNKLEFQRGDIVFVKSNPEKLGAVVELHPGQPENRFDIFIDNKIQTFYASQLQAQEKDANEVELISREQFHARLTALQIMHPGLSTLYSLNAARIDFIPYQFRPVLRFIKSERPRLLIADSVGVGKTIEAGLILRELQARRDIRSVLIICPRPLVIEKKWQNEMKRFEEKFTHLDGDTLRYCVNETHLDGRWPEQHRKTIIPYSLFDETLLHGSKTGKRRKGLLDLDPPPRFDLVIVDEAHHIRNKNTYRHEAVRFFCDNAEAAIFLTATPIQLGSNDLFVLLNLLRPDLVLDRNSFDHMAKPNPFINQAVAAMRSKNPEWQSLAFEALIQAVATPWGQAILSKNPDFLEILSQLKSGEILHEQRVKMITTTEGMHTFAGIINRTRRRDIGDFTVRKPQTVNVLFTDGQRCLHDELLRIQEEIFRRIHVNINMKFIMTTIRRQAASCLFGLAPFLEDILNRHIDELSNLSIEEDSDDGEYSETSDIDSIQAQIQALLNVARTLDPNDPKLESLREIIRNKQTLPKNKIMVFSSFRHTLSYILKNLCHEDWRVGLMHGGTPDEERIELRSRFEKPKEEADALDILLFSEIGCEGLDYQFCDCIVNYDLPWNPMRVDQRIGRIDRNGQKSESIAIFNLITPGTVDADIYERCLERIGVFERALGGNEEIFGEITQGIMNIANNFELTEEERREKLQQLADNEIRILQEQEAFEDQQAELFGIGLSEAQMNNELAAATNFWLSPGYLQNMARLYLQSVCGQEQEFILGEKPLKKFRLSQEVRNNLLKDFQQISSRNTPVYREWENWLKGGNQYLPITFDYDCAMRHYEAAFIMPLHPLVKQAAMFFNSERKILTSLRATSDEIPAGRYEFAIYQWRYSGIREDLLLKPVASDNVVTEHLIRLLEQAAECAIDLREGEVDASVWEELDKWHYDLWNEAKAVHCRKTQELATHRKESLTTSHKARIAQLQEQIDQATNEKIRRMRHSEKNAAESDYARRIQELDIAAERAEIVADPVAYGIIHVFGGSTNAC